MTNVTLKVKVKVTSFPTRPRVYMINTWFTFKGKIQNDSKVIAFKKNYTDDADDGTKSSMSLLGRGGGGYIIKRILTKGLQTKVKDMLHV